jgi:hypothetical protein
MSLNPALETAPLVERLPGTLGVRYTKNFREYIYTKENPENQQGDVFSWVFPVGEASVSLFDSVFAAMFDHTEVIGTERGSSSTPEDLAVIFEPKISDFYVSQPVLHEIGVPSADVRVTYTIEVFTRDNESVTVLRAKGTGTAEGLAPDFTNVPGRAADAAMRNAAARFLEIFYSNARIARWRASQRKSD